MWAITSAFVLTNTAVSFDMRLIICSGLLVVVVFAGILFSLAYDFIRRKQQIKKLNEYKHKRKTDKSYPPIEKSEYKKRLEELVKERTKLN
jgi:hypothetical protein